MEERFSWIPFYQELAKALLVYKNDRKPLVDFIYTELSTVGERSLVDYIHMEDGSRVKDIDPFSVFAIFNRQLRIENKIAFLQKFKARFNLQSDVPKDFDGIPTVNSQRAFFFEWADKNLESIQNLWDIFECAVLGKDISQVFDRIVNKWISQYSLTMVLYWIAPDRYLNLDGRNRSYLSLQGFADNYPNLKYAEYSQLMQEIRQKMGDSSTPYSSFPEFSYTAWSLGEKNRIWMYKKYDDAFSFDVIKMGSSAEGQLDFSTYKSKKALGDAYRQVSGNTDVSIPDMYWKLMKEVKAGDIVVVFDTIKRNRKITHELYGWGRITSDVFYDTNNENPIQRKVEWHRPLPESPVKETKTSNTRYFHEVTGIEAANIMNLLNINEEEGIAMDNTDKYIQLLKSNKNLILTGAPGTGKTYLAKQIAKKMLHIEDDDDLQKDKRFGFVQFHPSYDYTDFVEGLRPVKDSLGAIGFKRQDGVFKEFCKQAILSETADEETMDDINSNPTVWKVSLEGTGDNPTRTDCLENGYIRIGWQTYGDVEDFNDYEDFYDGGKNVLRAFQRGIQIGDLVVSCYSAKEIDAIGVITGDYEYRADGGDYPRYRNVRWLVKNIRENIIKANKNKPFTLATVYKANITAESALKIVQKYDLIYANRQEAPRKDTAVFIIDEINRGEISKIFGELFFSIDPGYRGIAGRVKTQYQNLIEEGDAFKEGFYVPENVYLIGTMNDIDRSVESMDFAMRRRFAWAEVTAEESMQMLSSIDQESEVKTRMRNLNNAILNVRGLGEAYQIGAAYFKKISEYSGDFQKLWDFHLKGLLFEYLRGNMNAEEQLKELKKAYDNNVPADGAADTNK